MSSLQETSPLEMLKPGVYAVKSHQPSKSKPVFKTKSIFKPFILSRNVLKSQPADNNTITGIDVNLKKPSPSGNEIGLWSSGLEKNVGVKNKTESILINKKPAVTKTLAKNDIFTGIGMNLKKPSPNGNEIGLWSSGLEKNKAESILIKKKQAVTKTQANNEISGPDRKNTQGQLALIDSTAPPATEVSSVSATNKIGATVSNKLITLIYPSQIPMSEMQKSSELFVRNVKFLSNKETQTTIYSLLTSDGQMLDTVLDPSVFQFPTGQTFRQSTSAINYQRTKQDEGALALPPTVKDPKPSNPSCSSQKTTMLMSSQLPARDGQKNENTVLQDIGTLKHSEESRKSTSSLDSTSPPISIHVADQSKLNFVHPIQNAVEINRQDSSCLSKEKSFEIVNSSKQVICEKNTSHTSGLSLNDSVNTISSNIEPVTNQSNQLISSTCHGEVNKCDRNCDIDNFDNLSDNNLQKIKNPSVMWPPNKHNPTMGVEDSILLCALKDMEMCCKENEYGNILLQKAVLKNDKTLLNRQCIILKAMGSNYLNHQNKNLETALILAVKSNLEDFVATLLNYGANQNIVDKDGNTALHVAVSRRLLVITQLLLAAEGARDVINIYNDEGFAPIHIAAMNGFNDVVRCLISEGAEINKKDAKSGRTAYHHAIDLKKQDVVNVLEGLGCVTGEPDFAGHLPLLEENIAINLENTSSTKQTTLSEKNTENKNKVRANKVNDLEQTNSVSRKRQNVTSQDDNINKECNHLPLLEENIAINLENTSSTKQATLCEKNTENKNNVRANKVNDLEQTNSVSRKRQNVTSQDDNINKECNHLPLLEENIVINLENTSSTKQATLSEKNTEHKNNVRANKVNDLEQTNSVSRKRQNVTSQDDNINKECNHLPLLEENIVINLENTSSTKQATLSEKNTEHKNNVRANKVNDLEQTNSVSRKRQNVTSEDDIINKETMPVPKKKRLKNKNHEPEVLSLSSNESDDDCLVVLAKYRKRKTYTAATKKSNSFRKIGFKPGVKRQSSKNFDGVLDISSDDDLNSDCEIICSVSHVSRTNKRKVNSVPRIEDNSTDFIGFTQKHCDESEAYLTSLEMAIKKFIINSQIY